MPPNPRLHTESSDHAALHWFTTVGYIRKQNMIMISETRIKLRRSLEHAPHSTEQPNPRRTTSHARSSKGLTTLEWLLIVAAVAGLAALAVVLVQNVVDETAEEISGSNARITAAEVAAARITSDARAALPKNSETATGYNTTTPADWQNLQKQVDDEFSSKCNRLTITYSDAKVTSDWKDVATASGAGSQKRGSRSDMDSQDAVWGGQTGEVYCHISKS